MKRTLFREAKGFQKFEKDIKQERSGKFPPTINFFNKGRHAAGGLRRAAAIY